MLFGWFLFLLALNAVNFIGFLRHNILYFVSITSVKTAFPFNGNEGKCLLQRNAVVACLKIKQHSWHPFNVSSPRIFTG